MTSPTLGVELRAASATTRSRPLPAWCHLAKERKDLLGHGRPVSGPRQMILPSQNLQGCSRDLAGHQTGVCDRDDVLVAVQYQRRNRQATHKAAHIDEPQRLDQSRRHGRAGRCPLERPGGPTCLRAREAGSYQIDKASFPQWRTTKRYRRKSAARARGMRCRRG